MDSLIQKDLRHGPQDSLGILEFLSEWLGDKFGRPRKESPEEGNVNGILDAAQIDKAKGLKGHVPPTIDLLFSFNDFLHQ